MKFAVNAFVISLPTEQETHKVLEDIFENADVDVVERFRKYVRQAGQSTSDKKGMWVESSFEDLIQFNDGFKTGLIGTPDQIAQRMYELRAVSVDMVLAGFLDYDDELIDFGRQIIPLVRVLEVRL